MTGKRCVTLGQKRCQIESFEIPRELSHAGYLMEVHASLISPGTELLQYRHPAPWNPPFHGGYTAVGKIVKADAAADPGRIGRRFYLFPEDDRQMECHASHREVQSDALLVPLPEGLSSETACFARMINIALTPFSHVGGKAVDSVLIVGLGLVGQVVAQVARIRGYRTIGMDPDRKRRERAEAAGIDATIDPLAGDPVQAVKELTGEMGASLTINATGRTDTFPMSVSATAGGGEVSTLGSVRQNDDTSAFDILHQVQNRHVTIRGGWEMLLPRLSAPGAAGPSTEENLKLALRWLAEGKLNLDPIWTHTIAPEGMPDAFAALDRMDPEYLGVVVKWNG